jgi:hypothetical protein
MSKKVSFKQKHVAGPPKGERWVWHSADMRTTKKWRTMPLMCHRLLERIELEHMAHKGLENGRLSIAYSQFEEWGIDRTSIRRAIKYAVDAGFLEVPTRGWRVKDAANTYRLTYYATSVRTMTGAYEWSAPTNEWKRRAGESFFLRAKSATALGPKVPLTGEAVEQPQTPKTAETLVEPSTCCGNALGPNVPHTTISSSPIPGRRPPRDTAKAERTARTPSRRRPAHLLDPLEWEENFGEIANSTAEGERHG